MFQHPPSSACLRAMHSAGHGPALLCKCACPAEEVASVVEGGITIPDPTLLGLDAILEVLHASHLAQRDGDPDAVLGEHLVEGLIVAGRALARSAHAVRGSL